MFWQQVYTQKPINIYGRMGARHQHHTRAAAGVSRGFGNLIVSKSFNHEATNYNNLPAEIREAHNIKDFKRRLKDWIQKNIKSWTELFIYNFLLLLKHQSLYIFVKILVYKSKAINTELLELNLIVQLYYPVICMTNLVIQDTIKTVLWPSH